MSRIYMRALLAVIALCAGSLQLGGCATNPVTGGNDFVLMSEDQEISLGRKKLTSMLRMVKFQLISLTCYLKIIISKE